MTRERKELAEYFDMEEFTNCVCNITKSIVEAYRRELRKHIIGELKGKDYTEAEIERIVDKREEEIIDAAMEYKPDPIISKNVI